MQQFIKQHDMRFPIVLDTQYEVAQMYSVRGTPTTYLINRTGKIVGGTAGPKDWASDTSKNMIRQLLRDAS
jgi:peroxiredoxin